jgi:hypothetical protein
LNAESSSKAALQYLIEEASHFDPVIDVDGHKLVRDRAGNLRVPPPEPLGDPLQIESLTGLRDFLAANIDKLPLETYILHVRTPASVVLLGPQEGRHLHRQAIVQAKADIPTFRFGDYQPAEVFRVGLLSMFEVLEQRRVVESTDQRRELLEAIARLSSGTKIVEEDDGVAQTVTVQASAQLMAEKQLPNPVLLTPYRAFTEVLQVSSLFILRAQGREGGVALALFEADGGAWRNEARQRVARHLGELLEGLGEGAVRPHIVF